MPTRLNDKRRGAIVLIMQRLHEDDPVGHVQRLDDWRLVSLPAIATEDEVHRIVGPYGHWIHNRSAGEALHPDREPLEILAGIRRAQGSDHFSAQYQQAPTPPGGGLIKVGWLVRYFEADLPERFEQLVQSWDTASKSGQLNDPSVCTTWGVKNGRYWLLHVLRDRMEYPDLKRRIVEHARAWSASVVLIEDAASGIALIQDLRRDGFGLVRAVKPEGDKLMRARAQTAKMESGLVLVPEAAPWRDTFLHELAMFPKGRHDDQVDSTTQALQWFGAFGGGILEYYRQQSADLSPQPGREVVLAGPSSHLQTLSGQSVAKGADGYFRLSANDAAPLIGIPGWEVVDAA